MENLLRVSNTVYPDGTLVKYMFGMKKPRILSSGIQISPDMWLKSSGRKIMRIRREEAKMTG